MPRKKFRRLPDGFGRIIFFGKRNLRNPYTARKRVGSDPEGKPVYKTIGSFPTYAAAFVTRASECGIIPTAARQIVGHSSGDVHVSVYTKHSPEFLLEEIKKLKYF